MVVGGAGEGMAEFGEEKRYESFRRCGEGEEAATSGVVPGRLRRDASAITKSNEGNGRASS